MAAGHPGAKRRAHALLEQFEVAQHEARYPWELSAEEQQRVATARALAGEPKLLLFDEPFPVLSPELARELAAKGMTLLAATDELGFARSTADRVVFMDGGRIIEQSSPDEFFTTPRTTRAQDYLTRARRR